MKTVPLKQLFQEALKKNRRIVNKPKKRKKQNTSSGFYRVQKVKCERCKQGFTWSYRVVTKKGDHKITRTSLLKLKKDIKDMGFEWYVVDEKRANQTAKNTNINLDLLR